MKFFGIKKYILSQVLHNPFCDFGDVYHDRVLMPIHLFFFLI